MLALLADIISLEEDIDRAVEAVAVRDIRAVDPALIAELFNGKRHQFLIDLEAEVNLPALDVFLGPMLTGVTSMKIDSCPRPGKAAVFFDALDKRGHPGATGFEKCDPQVRVAVGDPFRDHAMEGELHGQPE